MKIIYRATDILEAHIVCGMLNAEGLEAEVAGYYQQGAVGSLAPQDFAHVMLLDERDAALAEQVIAAYEQRTAKPPQGDGREGELAGGQDSSQLAWWLLLAALIVLLASWGLLA